MDAQKDRKRFKYSPDSKFYNLVGKKTGRKAVHTEFQFKFSGERLLWTVIPDLKDIAYTLLKNCINQNCAEEQYLHFKF